MYKVLRLLQAALRRLFSVFLFMIVFQSGFGMNIVSSVDGNAVIIIPDSPSKVSQYAAEELRDHITLVTGEVLDIVHETAIEDNANKRIYIGPCKATLENGLNLADMAKNSYVIKITENAMFLGGKDGDEDPIWDDTKSMGTLLAVYDWIGSQLNVKWLWPGELGTVVPKVDVLDSGPQGVKNGTPRLLHSRLRVFTSGFGNWNWDKYGSERAERFARETNVWLRRHGFVRTQSLDYGHAFGDYWKRFGEKHPEYFALRSDGKRTPFDERTELIQMCVSNQGLHRQIITDWIKQRKRDPEKPWINGCENDRRTEDEICHCETCLSWDAKEIRNSGTNPWLIRSVETEDGIKEELEHSVSDRYAKFWLALQAEGQKHDPAATVVGLAYAGYTDPPTETKLNERIIVGIVPPYFFPLDKESKNNFRKLWDGWAKTGARLFLRPNYTLEGYCVPYLYSHEFADEYKHAQQNGMIATDFDALTGMWGVQGPTLYLLARLNEHPEMKTSEILSEYYSGFGAGAPYIREYFDYWENLSLTINHLLNDVNHPGGWSVMSHSGDYVYAPETFSKGREYLGRARDAASEDPKSTKRIDFLDTWLTHAELAMHTLSAYRALKENPTDSSLREALVQSRNKLDEFRMNHPNEFSAANLPVLNQLEAWAGWRYKSLRK